MTSMTTSPTCREHDPGRRLPWHVRSDVAQAGLGTEALAYEPNEAHGSYTPVVLQASFRGGREQPRLDGGPAGGRRALDLWLLVGIALAALGVIAVRLRRARTGAATGKPPPVPGAP